MAKGLKRGKFYSYYKYREYWLNSIPIEITEIQPKTRGKYPIMPSAVVNKTDERRFIKNRKMVMFKKIASILASAVMLGSTMGAAFAANYPAPFVSGGSADVALVYGTNAATSDLASAIDIQTNLQSKVTGSSGSSATSSGGDSATLSSSGQKLYVNSSLSAARTVLTKDHLPTLLADGSAYDNAGTEYKYTQIINPGIISRKVTFGKSAESIDPALILDLGYSITGGPAYNYTLTFSKVLNVSSTDVVGTAEIMILGNKYTIGSNSDSNTLYLYGSGTTTTVEEGNTATVTVSDKDHTVMLVGTSATNTATIEVDGSSRSVTKGNSYKFADGFEIYVKDLFHATKTGTLSRAELLIGSTSLHFEDGQSVRVGADDTSLLGTSAEITGTAGVGISQIMISQAAESSIGDYLKPGQSYTDRIFKSLVLDYTGPVPELESDSRNMLTIDTDNSIAAKITFTSALADGKEYSLNYARDSDQTADSSLARVDFSYDNNLNMTNIEGGNAKMQEYLIVNDGDYGMILRVDSIPAGTSTSDKLTLTDVITGEKYEPVVGDLNTTTAAQTWRGGTYNVKTNPSNADSALWTVNVTWGAGSAAGNPGTQITLYPRIKLANGEWLSFLTQASIPVTPGATSTATAYSLPGLYTLSDYKAGSALTLANATAASNITASTTFGNVVYNISSGVAVNATSHTLDKVMIGGTACVFNNTMGPAILIQEPKTVDTSNGHVVCIPLTTSSGSNRMPAIGTPLFSDTLGSFATLQSNSYKSQAVDLYGTWVERDTTTNTNGAVTLSVPSEQMYVDVFFRGKDTSITPGSAGSSMGTGNVLIFKDSESESFMNKNLVVIGGSCVNTVARKLVDSEATSPICGADFTAKTNVGAGQYLLKSMESPYNKGKIAMLVAGYEAANTASAAAKLKEGHATDKGTSNVYPVLS